MRVFALLHRVAAVVGGVHQFSGKALFHGVLVAVARRADDPADSERLAALQSYFDRHLICRAADAARTHLDRWPDIAERVEKGLERILTRTLGDAVERAVDDAFGDRLLALMHQAIHEFGQNVVAEFGVRQDFAFDGGAAAGHGRSLLRAVGAGFGAALVAVLDTLGVERAANDVIAHAGQILDAAAADPHHRMLLQVMAFARDVAGVFEGVGETHARDFAQRGVGLLRRRRVNASANAALLRALLERRHLVARGKRAARVVDQLIDRRHLFSTSSTHFHKHNSRVRAHYAPPSRPETEPQDRRAVSHGAE